jgi:hypothetical protein
MQNLIVMNSKFQSNNANPAWDDEPEAKNGASYDDRCMRDRRSRTPDEGQKRGMRERAIGKSPADAVADHFASVKERSGGQEFRLVASGGPPEH